MKFTNHKSFPKHIKQLINKRRKIRRKLNINENYRQKYESQSYLMNQRIENVENQKFSKLIKKLKTLKDLYKHVKGFSDQKKQIYSLMITDRII